MKPDLVEGDGHLNLIAGCRQPALGEPDSIPRQVISMIDVVVEGIHLNTEGIDNKLISAPLIIEGVEHDPDPVIVPQFIPIGIPGEYSGGIRIETPKGHQDPLLIPGQPNLGGDRRRGILGGTNLEGDQKLCSITPCRLVDHTVNDDLTRSSGNRNGRSQFVPGAGRRKGRSKTQQN